MTLIEELKKDDVPALCFLSSEARLFLFRERKRGNVLTLCACGCAAQWLRCDEELSMHKVYRLAPKYRPGPEYVDLEIVKSRCGEWLGVSRTDKYELPLCSEHLNLHCLPTLPGFHCFWQEENNEGYKDTEHISFEVVATAIAGGKKIHARFRKGETK